MKPRAALILVLVLGFLAAPLESLRARADQVTE
jgi:hypothetical protein